MILKQVRVLLENGDTMRVLCCLLLLWSVLLSGCGESKAIADTPVRKSDEAVAEDAKASSANWPQAGFDTGDSGSEAERPSTPLGPSVLCRS
jgi:hypothetical protein